MFLHAKMPALCWRCKPILFSPALASVLESHSCAAKAAPTVRLSQTTFGFRPGLSFDPASLTEDVQSNPKKNCACAAFDDCSTHKPRAVASVRPSNVLRASTLVHSCAKFRTDDEFVLDNLWLAASTKLSSCFISQGLSAGA